LNIVDHPVRGLDNFGATSITQGDHHGPVGEMFSFPGDGPYQLLSGSRKLVQQTYGEKPCFSFMKGRPFLKKKFFKERHEQVDLGLGPVPVLLRERVQRDDGNAEPIKGIEHFADGNQALPVTRNARQPAMRGPAAVPIHNYGHVTGQRVLVELGKEVVLREFREGMC